MFRPNHAKYQYMVARKGTYNPDTVVHNLRQLVRARTAIMRHVLDEYRQVNPENDAHARAYEGLMKARLDLSIALAALNVVRHGGYFDKAIEAFQRLAYWEFLAEAVVDLLDDVGYKGYIVPSNLNNLYPAIVRSTEWPEYHLYPLKDSDLRQLNSKCSRWEVMGWHLTKPDRNHWVEPFSKAVFTDLLLPDIVEKAVSDYNIYRDMAPSAVRLVDGLVMGMGELLPHYGEPAYSYGSSSGHSRGWRWSTLEGEAETSYYARAIMPVGTAVRFELVCPKSGEVLDYSVGFTAKWCILRDKLRGSEWVIVPGTALQLTQYGLPSRFIEALGIADEIKAWIDAHGGVLLTRPSVR